jgi:hypothetical protein
MAHPTSAMTVGHHLPSAIPRSDEAKCVGGSRVAKNIGVMNRIDSDQTAPDHRPGLAAASVAIRTGCRRSSAENACGGGDGKRDENLLSTHGGSSCNPDAARIESMAPRANGKSGAASVSV